MKKINFLVIVLLVTFTVRALAQNTPSVIKDLNNVRVSEVLSELSMQTGYRFFYDPRQADSINVSVRLQEQPLKETLTHVFNNTTLRFFLDEARKSVFITKNQPITSLADNDKVLVSGPVKMPKTQMSSYFTDKVTRAAPVASIENKLYEIGIKSGSPSSGKVSLAGYVISKKTGEPLAGVQIFIESPRIGVSTNQFGYYSLSLPAGRHTLYIRGLGLMDAKRQIHLYSEGKLNIEAQEQVTSLKEVVISAEKTANVNRTTMGVERLDIKTIKQVPTVFGEADIMRVILTLPGVKSVGEASAGFNVRGGASDQNLILFNDATIYNPSHFFGFFSAFNPDVVKDVELYKSSIPSKYGGRLASVLDVSSREGNKKKFTGTAGLGLITSRLNIEGPIIKDRTSFIAGVRTTYSNWLLNALPQKSSYRNAKASFHDLNLHLSHKINEKNNIYITGYLSQDKSDLGTDTTFAYQNKNVSLKWKHSFNNKLYSVTTTGADNYQYESFSDSNALKAYRLNFRINQINFKTDFNYYINSKHTLDFGISSIYYKLNPGSFNPRGDSSLIIGQRVPSEQAVESAAYLGDRFVITPAISVDYGIRFSLFNYLGPKKVYQYAPNLPVVEDNVIDSADYSNGNLIKTYSGPEFRISARFAITKDFSIKAGYNTLRQYIHLLSNSTSISPTDIWKLSDPNIKPQQGSQVSLGLYKNFKRNTIETSAEVYYKSIKDFLDYKGGAVLILNKNIERDVLPAIGKAYGLEVLIKKLTGKLNGWISYTYSRTLLQVNNAVTDEKVNNGAFYAANYDKPHDLTIVSNFRFSHRVSTSFNFTYSTGRPITLPVSKFYHAGADRVYYSDRNEFRIPAYIRSDFSLNLEGNHKVHQLTHNSWTFGIYNLTGRKNAYSTYFVTEGRSIKGYKLSIFGSAIPFVNYNIRF